MRLLKYIFLNTIVRLALTLYLVIFSLLFGLFGTIELNNEDFIKW